MPELSLRAPALAENVIVVRELLRGIDRLLVVRPGLREAVLTAVSEAANNVVVHAYDGAIGPLQVDVSVSGPLEVVVRDWGLGFDPAAPDECDDPGFGRAVIEAFADEVDISSTRGTGTEVRLRWDVAVLAVGPTDDGDTKSLPGETVLTMHPDPALGGAAGRVLAALGARAGLGVDRLADLRLIAEALVAHARPVLVGGRLSFAFLQREGALQISVGPFVAEGAGSLRQARSMGGVAIVERLASELEVLRDPRTGHEALVLTVADARSARSD